LIAAGQSEHPAGQSEHPAGQSEHPAGQNVYLIKIAGGHTAPAAD
jgi:hypothetical protein